MFNKRESFLYAEVIYVVYFVEVIAAAKQPAKDFKSYHLFKGGHVQQIEVKPGFQTLIFESERLPEMRL